MIWCCPCLGTDVVTWTAEDVAHWLANDLGLRDRAEAFLEHKIDGPTLLELKMEDLERQLVEDEYC